MSSAQMVIPQGVSATINVSWKSKTPLGTPGFPETPQAVNYQVFDANTRAPVSPNVEIPVEAMASDMEIVVSPEYLPADESEGRWLVVQLRGTFVNSQDVDILDIEVCVKRGFEFST